MRPADAAQSVHGLCVSTDGTVLGSGEFDLETATELAITGVSESLWLLVYAAHSAPSRTLLEGRFIGTNLPPAPDREGTASGERPPFRARSS